MLILPLSFYTPHVYTLYTIKFPMLTLPSIFLGGADHYGDAQGNVPAYEGHGYSLTGSVVYSIV